MTAPRLNSALGSIREHPIGAPSWALAITAAVGVHALAAALYFAEHLADPPPEPFAVEEDELLVMLTPPAPPATEAAAPPPPPPPPDIELPDPPVEEPAVLAERADNAPPPAEITARVFAERDVEPVRRASAVSEAREGPAGPSFTPDQYRIYVDYVRDVRMRYVREVRYPREAERDGIEGLGVLRIRVSRNGRVEQWTVQRATGDPLLDQEVQRCAARIRRLPRIPRGLPYDELELEIPISFRIVN